MGNAVKTMKWYNIPLKHFIIWVLVPPVLALLLFLVNCGFLRVRPAEFFSGWWISVGVLFLCYELFFVLSWRICEADANGIRVRTLLGKNRGGAWAEFVYTGLASNARTPDRTSDKKSQMVLICARKMPYKGHPTDEGYLLHKGTIVLPLVEESRRALQTYCPNYSEALYVGIREI